MSSQAPFFFLSPASEKSIIILLPALLFALNMQKQVYQAKEGDEDQDGVEAVHGLQGSGFRVQGSGLLVAG